MSRRSAPKELRCGWTARKGEKGVYDCPTCGCWTGNYPLYKDMICINKDRRKARNDRRQA